MSANVLHYHVTPPAIVRSGPGVEKLKVVIHQRSFLPSVCFVELCCGTQTTGCTGTEEAVFLFGE